MAGAVEAVPADAVLGVQRVRQGVPPGLLRHALVEGGVEDDHLRHLRPPCRDGAQPLCRRAVVQRGQGGQPFDRPDDLHGHQGRCAEPLAAVHHPVSGRVDRPSRQHLLQVGIHLLQCRGVIRDPRTRHADPLHQSLGEDGLVRLGAVVVDLPHLVLQGGGAGVDDQDEHGGPFRQAEWGCCDCCDCWDYWDCAWMAVMATVFTMSSTVQPRERSFTGLFRPCSTGPTATAPADCCTAL